MRWTDEQKETMRQLTWTDGMTAAQVAEHTSKLWGLGVTRNVVLGILHRNGWAGADKEKPAQARARRRTANAVRRAKPPQFGYSTPVSTVGARESDPLPAEDPKPANCYALTHVDPKLERPDHTCQWFYGDPLEDPVGYCPKEKFVGLPYCEFHARKTFLMPDVKSRSTSKIVPLFVPLKLEPETA